MPCYIGISERLLLIISMGKEPNSSPFRERRAEVSFEPEAKIAFTSKQFAYHKGTSWGELFWTTTSIISFKEGPGVRTSELKYLLRSLIEMGFWTINSTTLSFLFLFCFVSFCLLSNVKWEISKLLLHYGCDINEIWHVTHLYKERHLPTIHN